MTKEAVQPEPKPDIETRVVEMNDLVKSAAGEINALYDDQLITLGSG